MTRPCSLSRASQHCRRHELLTEAIEAHKRDPGRQGRFVAMARALLADVPAPPVHVRDKVRARHSRSELWTLSLRARMVLQVEACKNHSTAQPSCLVNVLQRGWCAESADIEMAVLQK
jgi:hypothetical protein